jgi:hypothetical protein
VTTTMWRERFVGLSLVATLATGCSYQGAIKRDFNVRPVASRTTKLPLRVGVVQSSEFLEKMHHASWPSAVYG